MSERPHIDAPLRLEVEFRSTTSFLVAFSVDLSHGGIFLETDEPLEPGTKLRLLLRLPGLPGHTPTIEGEVAWTRARGDEPAGVGIRFLADAAEDLGTIIDVVVAGFAGWRSSSSP